MLDRMQRKRKLYLLPVRVQIKIAIMEIVLEVLQKIKNRTTIQPSYTTLRIAYPTTELFAHLSFLLL